MLYSSCMGNIFKLQHEATESATARGHKMGRWKNFGKTRNLKTVKQIKSSISKCVVCAKEVQVIKSPLPNEINIGGEAVALNCTGLFTNGTDYC